MRVPRPFDPDDFPEDEGEKAKRHIEREEKPLAAEDQRRSEDYHGGSESTESMPDSPNEGGEKSEEKQGGDQRGAGASEEQAQPGESQSNGEPSGESSSEGGGEQKPSVSVASGESSESRGEQSPLSPQSGDSESSGDPSEEGADSSEDEDEGEGADSSEEGGGEAAEEAEAEDADEAEAEDADAGESGEQVSSNVGAYNTQQVFDYAPVTKNVRLAEAFYNFIEYIADETRTFSNISAEYYEPKKLMLRRYKGESLNAAKSGKVRETVVVLLDNSGSMRWVEPVVLAFARLAVERHDAEVYFAPNGNIETRLTARGEAAVDHGEVVRRLITQQMKVVYVGDFDGGDIPITLSWVCRVFWLCPENRYLDPAEHDWVHYGGEAFKGFFARTYTADEMVQALKRFAGSALLPRLWLDPHRGDFNEQDYERGR